jgi:adenine-specific DNA methylase
MLRWARDCAKKASKESFGRLTAIEKNPALLDDPLELRRTLLDFIADFANWDNSTDADYLATSRALVQAAHEALGGEPGTRPLVVDPFAGGGSIPLEALRVGADAFASDLNPVAVLLNKVVLEYIPKYGTRLADEVRKWGERLSERVDHELGSFYPLESDGTRAVGYLWARTVLSEAPSAGEAPVEVPILRSMWLCSKPKRRFAFRWLRDSNGLVCTETVRATFADGSLKTVRRPLVEVFQPASASDVERGTSAGGAVTCPVTGFTTPVESVRSQLTLRSGGGADARMLCVVTTPSAASGRVYRLPQLEDINAVDAAKNEIQRRVRQHDSPVSLIPDGEINHLRGFFNVVLYGMKTWGDLFTPRQALALTHLTSLIKELPTKADAGELGAAVQTCLALALGRCADKCASVVVWNIPAEKIEHVFGRQALPMVWDFAEVNILADVGWRGAVQWVQKVIEHNAGSLMGSGAARTASALEQTLPDDTAHALVTDPPYYAAIPYADLSDFFYSWLKRALGETHTELFASTLSPKAEECVQLSHRAAMYRHKDSAWFEQTMTKACGESRRVVMPSGIGVVVFANKETPAWEAMLAALVSSGWIVTASWPIDTERAGRLRAMDSAALASSVHLVCRPRERADGSANDAVGDWREVLDELPRRIHSWMPRLAEEGVVGADAIFACLGPALEIFSRYSRVEKANGDLVGLREYLEHVWAAVSNEALSVIFKDADAAGLEPDARLAAMWLWTVGANKVAASGAASLNEDDRDEAESDEEGKSSDGKKAKVKGFTIEFDAARKIAQGLGVNLEKLDSLVEIKGDTARLLPVVERTRHLFGEDAGAEEQKPVRGRKKPKQGSLFEELQAAELMRDPSGTAFGDGSSGAKPGQTVLDRIHQAMILFAAGRTEAMKRLLVADGAGTDPRFWKLAQSLSALYPVGTDEKRWIDGVFARKKGLGL